jgi:predicted RNase H-like HicB family nuclease
MNFLVTFEKATDGTIWAKVPDLDGCFSCGDTIEEAKENIKDAITLYLEDLKEEGKTIPQPTLLRAELVAI